MDYAEIRQGTLELLGDIAEGSSEFTPNGDTSQLAKAIQWAQEQASQFLGLSYVESLLSVFAATPPTGYPLVTGAFGGVDIQDDNISLVRVMEYIPGPLPPPTFTYRIDTVVLQGVTGNIGSTTIRPLDITGLSVDASGNCYVGDNANQYILWKIDPTGLVTNLAGDPATNPLGGSILDTAVDNMGHVFAIDRESLYKIDANGAGVLATIGSFPDSVFGHNTQCQLLYEPTSTDLIIYCRSTPSSLGMLRVTQAGVMTVFYDDPTHQWDSVEGFYNFSIGTNGNIYQSATKSTGSSSPPFGFQSALFEWDLSGSLIGNPSFGQWSEVTTLAFVGDGSFWAHDTNWGEYINTSDISQGLSPDWPVSPTVGFNHYLSTTTRTDFFQISIMPPNTGTYVFPVPADGLIMGPGRASSLPVKLQWQGSVGYTIETWGDGVTTRMVNYLRKITKVPV